MKNLSSSFSKRRLLQFLFLLTCCGCASIGAKIADMDQKEKFSEVSKSYKKAVLWSDFEYASEFLADGHADKKQLDPSYKKVKVTAFEEKRKIVDPEVKKIEQVVEIRYYWIDRMILKDVTEHLVWEWDPEVKFWFLTSGLPDFE